MHPTIVIEFPAIAWDPFDLLVRHLSLQDLMTETQAKDYIAKHGVPRHIFTSLIHKLQMEPLPIPPALSQLHTISRYSQWRFLIFGYFPDNLGRAFQEMLFQQGIVDFTNVSFLSVSGCDPQPSSSDVLRVCDRLREFGPHPSIVQSALLASPNFCNASTFSGLYPLYVVSRHKNFPDIQRDVTFLDHPLDFFVNLAEWSLWNTDPKSRMVAEQRLRLFPAR